LGDVWACQKLLIVLAENTLGVGVDIDGGDLRRGLSYGGDGGVESRPNRVVDGG